MPVLSLSDAVERHVRPHDSIYIAMGHHRWTALARELARQYWRTDPQFEIAMGSLSALGVLWFHGGIVRKTVTCYSGDAFPTYGPNPVYQRAYESGEVQVEHWSFLTFVRRLEAAALGLPAAAHRPLGRTSFAANAAYSEAQTEHGPVGLLAPYQPDVALLHAALADEAGNVVVAPPTLDGVASAFAARRGALVTVEKIVDDVRQYQGFVRIPAHRVLAVVEAPFGAHPGGLYGTAIGVDGYAEDIEAWVDARNAARGDLDAFCKQWCLDVDTHEKYLKQVGDDRLKELQRRLNPATTQEDIDANPVDETSPATPWETAAAFAVREVMQRITDIPADAVLAGAGVANIAAWVAVSNARASGSNVTLVAELGLWDYTPEPADPSIFNFRNFPSAALVADAPTALGLLVGGPGTRVLACLGAAQVDSNGDINSTQLGDGRFLAGAGGGTDVALGADECLVLTLLGRARTPERVGYVTAPGDRVQTIVTDLGVIRRRDGVLRLAAVPGDDVEAAVKKARESCGWPLETEREVANLTPPSPDEVIALRRFDPRGLFLSG